MAETPAPFWSHIRRRVVVISTMERDVRITFIAGLAVVALAIALNVFHDNLGPPVRFLVGTIPLGALLVLAAGEFIVFFLLSVAALLIEGRWRSTAYATMLITFLVYIWANDFQILSFAIAVPIAMLWAFNFFGDRQGWRRRRYQLCALATSLTAMLIMVVYAASGHDVLVISALGWQGLVAMFGLWMAATDIAEMALVAVESATAGARPYLRDSRAALVFAILAIVANLLLPLTLTDTSASAVAQSLGSGTGLALWLGLIYWMVISWRRRLGAVDATIGYKMLFVIVGIYFAALQAGILWQILSDPVTYDAKSLFAYPRAFTFTTLAAFAFIVLFLIIGRRSHEMFVRLALGVTVGLFIFHYYSSQGRNIVLMLDAVAVASLLLLAFARLSRKMREQYGSICLIVADLNLAFVAYGLIATLFLSMGGRGGFSAGQALIILLALGWDIVFSGEAITNRHSETFPRLARVAAFLAYISSVALLVMVSTASELQNPVTGQAVEGIFDSEPIVGVGLVFIGAPFIFLIALLRIRNVLAESDANPSKQQLRAAPRGPAESQPADAAVPPA